MASFGFTDVCAHLLTPAVASYDPVAILPPNDSAGLDLTGPISGMPFGAISRESWVVVFDRRRHYAGILTGVLADCAEDGNCGDAGTIIDAGTYLVRLRRMIAHQDLTVISLTTRFVSFDSIRFGEDFSITPVSLPPHSAVGFSQFQVSLPFREVSGALGSPAPTSELV